MIGHPEVGGERNQTFAPIIVRRISQEQTGILAIHFFLFSLLCFLHLIQAFCLEQFILISRWRLLMAW